MVQRELLEETGYEGKKWFFHGSFVGDASKQCGTYYIYTAADLKKITEPNSDDLEDVKTLLLTEKELMKIALSCSDSSVSLGFWLQFFLQTIRLSKYKKRKKMKILVTGGAGYIGSVLVPDLLRLDHDVKIYDNFVYSQASLNHCAFNKKFSVVKGDIRDSEK